MGVGTTAGILGTSLASAGLGAYTSLSAAGQQAGAARDAAQLQYDMQQQALQFQEQQYNTQQQNLAPWLTSGRQALSSMDYLMGLPGFNAGAASTTMPSFAPAAYGTSATLPFSSLSGTGGPPSMSAARAMPAEYGPGGLIPTRNGPVGRFQSPITPASGATGAPTPNGTTGGTPSAPGASPTTTMASLGGGLPEGYLMQTWNTPFTAPTAVTEQNDPGYQARLKLATDALQNSAASRGGLLSGNTARAMDQYSQDYASNEYNNVYSRALGQYQQAYNIFNQNQANVFNRLAALSGTGQVTAQQLGMLGNQAGSTMGNILLGGGAQIGQQMNNAAAATASGYMGAGSAISGGLNNISQYMLMQSLLNGQAQPSSTGLPQYPS